MEGETPYFITCKIYVGETEKVGPAYLLPEGINQGNNGRILVDQIHVQVHHLSHALVRARHDFVLSFALMRVRKAVKDKWRVLQMATMSFKLYFIPVMITH